MLQYFVRSAYDPVFHAENHPHLLYASLVDWGMTSFNRVMHSHDDYVEVLLVHRGTAEYLINDRKHLVQPGDMVIYNSGVIHDEGPWADHQLKAHCLAIGGLALPGLHKNALLPDGASPVLHCGDALPELETLCEMIFSALRRGGRAQELYAQSLTEAFLLRCLPLLPGAPAPSPEPEPESALGARIKAHLDQHYAEDLGMPELAAALHLSAPYLSHVFKKLYGYSPMNYLLRRRIGEAQTLLITTDLSVTEIGERVGYETTSYFSAQFTKHVGVSPKAYRKNFVGKGPEG